MDRAYKTEWQRRNRRAFKDANGYSTTSNYSAGGNRAAVLERDDFSCVQCGMTDEQHRERWSRPITVDHISKDRSDNRLANLQTLCLSCHGRKDLIERLRTRKAEPLVPEMKRLRADGMTYNQIAAELALSAGCVWKYLNGKMS